MSSNRAQFLAKWFAGEARAWEDNFGPGEYSDLIREGAQLLASIPGFVCVARVHRAEPMPGIRTVHLELVRDEDHVELHDGDEFVTVALKVDPWEVPDEQ